MRAADGKMSFSVLPPPKQHGVSEPQSNSEEGLCWVRESEGGGRKRSLGGEGKGGTLPPRCLVQEQPEQQQQWRRRWGERHRLAATHGTGSIRPPCEKLLLAGCPLSRLEYIVSVWARYPIGRNVNKERKFLYHGSHNKEERERSRAAGFPGLVQAEPENKLAVCHRLGVPGSTVGSSTSLSH
ncbi:hypothetical protein EYF80_030524 [Liparis tanakae]|uniref:Uncharacterized protein n=1 Tax=Liparis tanakae TaxID=230148 RepID=A0A4Z2H0E8_9TELE|nr:hypothetical protein EYF80_030524 [Liparis tanakae]